MSPRPRPLDRHILRHWGGGSVQSITPPISSLSEELSEFLELLVSLLWSSSTYLRFPMCAHAIRAAVL